MKELFIILQNYLNDGKISYSFTRKWNLLSPSDHLSNTLLTISAKMRSISACFNQREFGWDMQGRGPTRRNMGPHWQDWLTWSTRSLRKEQNNSITRNIPQTVAMSLCDSWQQPLRTVRYADQIGRGTLHRSSSAVHTYVRKQTKWVTRITNN